MVRKIFPLTKNTHLQIANHCTFILIFRTWPFLGIGSHFAQQKCMKQKKTKEKLRIDQINNKAIYWCRRRTTEIIDKE